MIVAASPTSPTSGVFYAYTRVSSQHQVDSGLSLGAQEQQVRAYFSYLNTTRGIPLEWGGIYEDRAESAFKKKFTERPAGRAVNERVRRGDHVVFTKLDRGFRDPQDMLNMTKIWLEIGVMAHFLDINLDMSTAIGEMIATFMAALAKWESRRRSERVLAAKDESRRRGKVLGGGVPIGMKPTRYSRFVETDEEHPMYQMVLALRGADSERPVLNWSEMQRLLFVLQTPMPPLRTRLLKPGHAAWNRSSLGFYHQAALNLQLEPSIEYLMRYPDRIPKLGRKEKALLDRVIAAQDAYSSATESTIP